MITAVTARIARTKHVEQFDHNLTVAQAIERQTTVCQTRLLAERDERLDDATQFPLPSAKVGLIVSWRRTDTAMLRSIANGEH